MQGNPVQRGNWECVHSGLAGELQLNSPWRGAVCQCKDGLLCGTGTTQGYHSELAFYRLDLWLSLGLLVASTENQFRQLFCLKDELKKMGLMWAIHNLPVAREGETINPKQLEGPVGVKEVGIRASERPWF